MAGGVKPPTCRRAGRKHGTTALVGKELPVDITSLYARVEAAERFIAELRAMLDASRAELAEARRPFWRRWGRG